MTCRRKENNMDKQLEELLLSTARNLENLANHEDNYSKQGYILLIAQDIYTYLDAVAED